MHPTLPLLFVVLLALLHATAAVDVPAIGMLNALRFKPLLAEISRGSDLLYVPPNSFSHFKVGRVFLLLVSLIPSTICRFVFVATD